MFVDFCLDGKALVGCEGTSVLWTRPLDQPGPRRLLPGVESQINSVCLSPDGRLLAAAARTTRDHLESLLGNQGTILPGQ